jgi:hypothetical protein
MSLVEQAASIREKIKNGNYISELELLQAKSLLALLTAPTETALGAGLSAQEKAAKTQANILSALAEINAAQMNLSGRDRR